MSARDDAVCVCMPQVECPLHPDAGPTPEGVVLGAEEVAALKEALQFPTEAGNMFGGYDCACGAPWLSAGCADGGEEKWEQRDAATKAAEGIIAARLAAERAAREGLRAAVEGALADIVGLKEASEEQMSDFEDGYAVAAGDAEGLLRAALAAGDR